MPPASIVTATVTTTTLNLASTFTPPSSCLAPTYTVSPSGNDVVDNLWDPVGATVTRGVLPECYPPNFTSVGQTLAPSEAELDVTAYASFYSPGACPLGYSSDIVAVRFNVTTATCCPSSLTFKAETHNSTVTSWCENSNKLLGAVLNGTSILTTTITTIKSNDPFVYTTTEVLPQFIDFVYVLARPIVVANQLSDLSLWSTSSSSPTSATAIASSKKTAATSEPTATTIPSTSTPSSSRVAYGLSTGAKAGIGSGAAFGLIILILAAVLFVSWRRKRSTRTEAATSGDKAELSGEGKAVPAVQIDELDHDRAVHEVTGIGEPAMLDHANVRAELDSGWRGWEAPSQEWNRNARQDVGTLEREHVEREID